MVEPADFRVTITTADGDRTATVPDVFTLPNQDAYVKVTVTAADGSTWSRKVEVKARHQTEIVLGFVPEQKKPTKPRFYIGTFANVSQGCGESKQSTIRAELIDEDGVVAKLDSLAPRYEIDYKLTAGKYEMRTYVLRGSTWQFQATNNQVIPQKDGWKLAWGCVNRGDTPALHRQ